MAPMTLVRSGLDYESGHVGSHEVKEVPDVTVGYCVGEEAHRHDERRTQLSAVQPGGEDGSILYVSGMAGIDVATKRLAGATIQEQTRQALRNCAVVIEAAGGTLDDVVQVTVLLADPADFAGMNEEYEKVFAADPPARAVTKLGVDLPDLLVSIMMTAHVEV